MNTNTLISSAVALLIVTLLGAALLVGLNSERRIATARVMTEAQVHKAELARLLYLIAGAEVAERKYLLTENPNYLAEYRTAHAHVSQMQRELNAGSLAQSTGAAAPLAHAVVLQLVRQTSQVLSELESTLDIQQRLGREAAVADVQDHAGRSSMEAVGLSADKLQSLLDVHIAEEFNTWETAVNTSRALLISSTLLNALMLIGAGVLFSRQLRQTVRLNQQLTTHAEELESQVDHRTAELSALSSHLQRVAEHEKAAIARELHDELGGLMIAAKMDAAWLEKHPDGSDAEMQTRWSRLQKVLDDGLNLKRRVVETLRPTLLDNLGLIPAVKWVYQETCGRAGINCRERLPADEVLLSEEASIAVFRVVQESLTNIVKHAKASDVDLNMAIEDGHLIVEIADNGVGMRIKPAGQSAQGVASMKHRVHSLGGTLHIVTAPGGGTRIEIRLPLANIAAPEAVPEEHAA